MFSKKFQYPKLKLSECDENENNQEIIQYQKLFFIEFNGGRPFWCHHKISRMECKSLIQRFI